MIIWIKDTYGVRKTTIGELLHIVQILLLKI